MALASARRPPPSARATADETPPPNPPFDIVTISIQTGRTSETPARASEPRRETNSASAVLESAISMTTRMFGRASLRSVGRIGASRIRLVRGLTEAGDTTDDGGAESATDDIGAGSPSG